MHFAFVNTPRFPLYAALLAGAILVPGLASAASQCNGMQQNACVADGQCIWIDGYTRRDGRSVSSHCKTKARKKTPDQAALDGVKLSQKERPE